MTQKIKNQKQIHLPKEVLVKAQGRAHSLGLSLTEYVQFLVDKDVKTTEHDRWLEPVPQAVNEKWEQDIAEYDEQEKRHPRPGARTAEELIKLLDEDAAQLPDDEGN